MLARSALRQSLDSAARSSGATDLATALGATALMSAGSGRERMGKSESQTDSLVRGRWAPDAPVRMSATPLVTSSGSRARDRPTP